MIKRIVWFVCLGCLSAGWIFAQEKGEGERSAARDPMDLSGQPVELESLLAGYYQNAMGGAVNWAEIQSIRFHGVLELPQGAVEFVAFKKKPNYCKVVLYGANHMRVVMATDGEDAWQLVSSDSDEPRDMPTAEAVNFLRDATIGGHLLYPNLPGKMIELLGTARVEGELCYHFKGTLPDQQAVEYYVDVTDFVERRQVVRNAVTEQQEVITHFEHRGVHGLQIPFRSVMSVDGEQVHTVRLLDVDVNMGITSWMFARGSAAYVPKMGQSAVEVSTDSSFDFAFPGEDSGMESQFELPEIDSTQREQLLQDLEAEL